MTSFTLECQRALFMTRVQEAFQSLFQVWEGTENADDILADAARTIGYSVFDVEAADGALNYFEALCRSNDAARFAYPMTGGRK